MVHELHFNKAIILKEEINEEDWPRRLGIEHEH